MGLFDKLSKKHIRLETIISRLESNKANNYKDAAQANFKELEDCYETMSAAGELSERQKNYYDGKLSEYRENLKGYTHKDQKPFWT